MKAPLIDRAILRMCKYNREHPPIEISKRIEVAGVRIAFNWRSSKNLWGRFGGGWNWKFGIMASKSTVIFDILVFSIRIDKTARRKVAEEKITAHNKPSTPAVEANMQS